jgi:hypothetical protein
MFRPTKLGPVVKDLPIIDQVIEEGYMILFDRFGPWDSDDAQFVHLSSASESLTKIIVDGYTAAGETATPEVMLMEGSWLTSEDVKYVIQIKDEFFHVILNTLVVILYIYSKDPDAKFVILLGNENNSRTPGAVTRQKNVEFLSKVLDDNSIVFSVLESEYEGGGNVYPIYGVRNALVVNDHLTTVQLSLGEIASLIERYVLEKIDVPSIATGRKLYISRERDVEERSPYLIEGDASSGYEDNSIRLYGEVALERYLESRGFEIVKESALGSIEEQVRLMKSASVLVGVTGTGLTNVLFMNSESTVIELKTEILWSTGDHDANNHYNYLSYAKGHRYISLDVSNKQGSTAISKLERLFNALDLDKLV